MVGLSRQVGGAVVVDTVLLEGVVAQIAPQDGRHAQVVGTFEGGRDLRELTAAFGRSEIDRGAHGDGTHFPRLFDRTEQYLIVTVGVGQQFVVVDFYDERNLVGIAAGDGSQHAQRRGYAVAAAFDRQPDDIFGIEVDRIGGERRAGGVFDALVDGQDRNVARAAQPAVSQQTLQAVQRRDIAVGGCPYLLDGMRGGKVQRTLVDGFAGVGEQVFGLVAQQFDGLVHDFVRLK